MIFQVLSPIVTSINGDSLKEAIKNFAKVNYAYQFNNLLLADQINNRYQANINYYSVNNKNKIGIAINRASDNVGLTTYPKNSLQPILKESSNGNMTEIGYGIPLSLSPTANILSPTANILSPANTIEIKPMISAPNMISTTDSGIVLNTSMPLLTNPIMTPNYSMIARINL